MRIWFDTEFIERGPWHPIRLISLGAVREDGKIFYMESAEFYEHEASTWVQENVIAKLKYPKGERHLQRAIAHEFQKFAGEKPEFWAYYADYDWVVLCQLFGTMIALPDGWPMWCRDVKQYADFLGNPKLPRQDESKEHNALDDALHTYRMWDFLEKYRVVGTPMLGRTED